MEFVDHVGQGSYSYNGLIWHFSTYDRGFVSKLSLLKMLKLWRNGESQELRHKQDDLALCDNCGTYIYLPPDEMVVSPMPPAREGRVG